MARQAKGRTTQLEIVKVASELFFEKGFTHVSVRAICEIMNISTGNLTFYFPSKDDILAVLVEELLHFQNMKMEHAAEEGKSSLLAYCLELTAMAAVCEESEIARDFYAASYTSLLALNLIRANDTEKTRTVFREFCPDWTDCQWTATENIVSGIEYATIMTREADTPLEMQIERTLNSILLLYGVPEELRRAKISKVLAMDYRGLGRDILRDFREYIEKVNEKNLRSTRMLCKK